MACVGMPDAFDQTMQARPGIPGWFHHRGGGEARGHDRQCAAQEEQPAWTERLREKETRGGEQHCQRNRQTHLAEGGWNEPSRRGEQLHAERERGDLGHQHQTHLLQKEKGVKMALVGLIKQQVCDIVLHVRLHPSARRSLKIYQQRFSRPIPLLCEPQAGQGDDPFV